MVNEGFNVGSVTEKIELTKAETKNELDKHGILGKFWGISSSVPNNIASLVIIILIIFGIIFSCVLNSVEIKNQTLSIKEFWSIITPIITLSFGYIFGEKTKK